MIKRAVLALCAALFLRSEAAAQISPEAQASLQKYHDCMKTAAVTLDDGRSDAGTIGLGVASFCSAARRDFAVVSSHGSLDVQLATQQGLEARSQRDATAYVLASRAKKPAPHAAPAKPKAKGQSI